MGYFNMKIHMVLFQRKVALVLLLAVFILPLVSTAQDLHYTQFYNAPHTYNPAQTGVYKGDKRFQANVRDQWRWVPVPWFTFGMAYDQKIYPKKSENHFFSLGGSLAYDRQGDSGLNLSAVNVTGTYSRILSPNHILTAGLTLGFATRGFSTDDLTWDQQWNGETFDPSLGSGEMFANVERIYFLDTGLGLNYRFQLSSRTKFDIGVGSTHLIEPTAGFYGNEDQKLPRKFDFSFVGNFFLVDALDVQVHALHQIQNEYRETIVGALGKLYLSEKRGKETQLHAGLSYRFSGSLAPTLAIEYQQFYFGASYDSDNTDFNSVLQDNKGGPEFHFRYTITDVRPLKELKVCPIY